MCLEVAQRLSCRLLELVQEQSGEMHQQPSGDMIPPGLTAFKQGRLYFLSENNHRAFIDHFIWIMDDAFVNYIILVRQSLAKDCVTVSEPIQVHLIHSIPWLNPYGTSGSLSCWKWERSTGAELVRNLVSKMTGFAESPSSTWEAPEEWHDLNPQWEHLNLCHRNAAVLWNCSMWWVKLKYITK